MNKPEPKVITIVRGNYYVNQTLANAFWDGHQRFKKGAKHPLIDGLVFKRYDRSKAPYWVASEQEEKVRRSMKVVKGIPRVNGGAYGRVDQAACNDLLEGDEVIKRGDPHPYVIGVKCLSKSKGNYVWASTLKFNKDQKAQVPKRRAASNKRRCLKLGADLDEHGVSHYSEHDQRITEQMYAHARRLKECLGNDWHLDHVLPLSLGGSNKVNNLQIVPAVWNLNKLNTNTNVFGAWEGLPDHSLFNKPTTK